MVDGLVPMDSFSKGRNERKAKGEKEVLLRSRLDCMICGCKVHSLCTPCFSELESDVVCAVSLPLSGLPTHCAVLGPGLAWSRVVLPQPGAEAFVCCFGCLSSQAGVKPVDDLPHYAAVGEVPLRTRNLAWRSRKQWIMALGVGNPNAEARRMLDR